MRQGMAAVLLALAGVAYGWAQEVEYTVVGEVDVVAPRSAKKDDGVARGIFVNKPSKRMSFRARYPILPETPAVVKHTMEWLSDLSLDCFREGWDLLREDESKESRWTVDLDFTVKETPAAYTILYEVFSHLTSAAHPSTTVYALNYAKETGDPLGVEDLFENPEKAYEIFARVAPDLIKAAMKEAWDEEDYASVFPETPAEDDTIGPWMAEGTAADPDNYDGNLGIAPEGVEIYFQEYQVFPRALGRPVITVPLAELKDAGPNAKLWPQK